jgi:hypothetical protein
VAAHGALRRPLGLWAYYTAGRTAPGDAEPARTQGAHAAHMHGGGGGGAGSLARAAALGATHCGAGCALGDLIAESLAARVPIELFGRTMYATWALDFVFAFVLGIAFQYFTIAPMRNLGWVDGIVAALKADSISLTAWQVGMYGWMAITVFAVFGHELDKGAPVFWFMMQIAMMAGFLCAWPVNAVLIRAGWKEPM